MMMTTTTTVVVVVMMMMMMIMTMMMIIYIAHLGVAAGVDHQDAGLPRGAVVARQGLVHVVEGV
jgi:hypothetical protein